MKLRVVSALDDIFQLHLIAPNRVVSTIVCATWSVDKKPAPAYKRRNVKHLRPRTS